jgi:hypothetical protein
MAASISNNEERKCVATARYRRGEKYHLGEILKWRNQEIIGIEMATSPKKIMA